MGEVMDKEIKIVSKNKKANHEYFIIDTLECGIVLTGTEIKSIRESKISIQDAYCQIKNSELLIMNMHIAKYEQGNIFNHEEMRNRVLLAHKREINKLASKVTLEGLTLIPLEVYLKNGKAKVNIGLAKGKKAYDKREDIKNRDIKRDLQKNYKNQY